MVAPWLKWRSLWQEWAHFCCCTTVLSTLSYYRHPLPTGLSPPRLMTQLLEDDTNREYSLFYNFYNKRLVLSHVMKQSKLLHCKTYPQSHWCEHFGHSWHEWWAQQYRWGRPARILPPSSLPPASDSSGWENYRHPWHVGASPRWRMSNHTADTGRSYEEKRIHMTVKRANKAQWFCVNINGSPAKIIRLGGDDNCFSPHLINLSKTPSTHICIRRKLKPYLQSMRRTFIINQSLSSYVSSFPSNIAILEGTSFLGGIPEKSGYYYYYGFSYSQIFSLSNFSN